MADFSDYFDSGVLVKIYHLEPGSPEISERVKRTGAIPLPFLSEMEIRNAVRVLQGRKVLAETSLKKALSLMEDDIIAGRLVRVTPEGSKMASTSENLSRNFTASTLCRTLDLLHVSLALTLGVSRFHTGDKRQAQLAEAAGLQVAFLAL